MKPDRKQEAQRWLRQAEGDLRASIVLMQDGLHSHSCFMAQQTAEKALKALAYFRGDRYVLGHAISELLEKLDGDYPDLRPFKERLAKLDQYYTPTRYPDALPGGVPLSLYDVTQASDATTVAGAMVSLARRLIEGS